MNRSSGDPIFGAAWLAEVTGVRRQRVRRWRTVTAPGAGSTRLLLRMARLKASPACVEALEAHLSEREAALARRAYIGCTAIFSPRNGWPPRPEQARERERIVPPLRRPLPPPPLPEGLSEAQIALIRARFEQAGWTVIWSPAQQRLVPCRTI